MGNTKPMINESYVGGDTKYASRGESEVAEGEGVDEDASDITKPAYDKNRYSYGKVNRNRQMYILDAELLEQEHGQPESGEQIRHRDFEPDSR